MKAVEEQLKIVREILGKAKYPHGRYLRLGNRAEIAVDDFPRYEDASDAIIGELRKVNKRTLEMEKIAATLEFVDKAVTSKSAGKAVQAFQTILDNKTIEVWGTLREFD